MKSKSDAYIGLLAIIGLIFWIFIYVWPFILIVAVTGAIVFAVLKYNQAKKCNGALNEKCGQEFVQTYHHATEELKKVDMMEGLSFEHYVAQLLRDVGFFDVRVTQSSGDYGADVLACEREWKYAIQCKCYHSNLGVKPVQEICAARQYYGCDKAVVITNVYFSQNAHALAKKTDVLLWDRDELAALIQKARKVNNNDEVISHEPIAYQPIPMQNHSAPPTLGPITNQAITPKVNINIFQNTETSEMATVIGAGKYVFGTNVPLGAYDLNVLDGRGMLCIRYGKTENDEDIIYMGLDDNHAKGYANLSLESGRYFTIDGNLRVVISRSKMLVIE